MGNRSHRPDISRTKDWQERGDAALNIKVMFLPLLKGAGFESWWCYSLLTQAEFWTGSGGKFQGIGVLVDFWRHRMRKNCEAEMVQEEKREVQDAVVV